jgi:hypothetical protein
MRGHTNGSIRGDVSMRTWTVVIEAVDEVDADALMERIVKFLEITDNGDYSGRNVAITSEERA